MAKILALLIIAISFAIFMKTQGIWNMNRAQRKGLSPKKGKATLFDVRDLLIKGERELAIKLYCQIFETNRKQAVKAIEELEKNLKNS